MADRLPAEAMKSPTKHRLLRWCNDIAGRDGEREPIEWPLSGRLPDANGNLSAHLLPTEMQEQSRVCLE